MELNSKAIGKRIQTVRKQRKLSQAVLSEAIDKSTSYVSYIETGRKGMSLETFVRIADVLEVSADSLLSGQPMDTPIIAAREIIEILDGCNEYERLILMEALKVVRTALLEYRRIAVSMLTED